MDGVVGSAIKTTGIPSAVVSVVADGQLLTERGYGLADTGTGDTPSREVDPGDTLFRMGSVSKVITTTAVMQLVERGLLDLEANVQRYLDFDLPTPQGAVQSIPPPRRPNRTISHLARVTSSGSLATGCRTER